MNISSREGWESKLPKNGTIAMRLDPDVAEKIAKMAWENGIKTTKQAKLILAAGMRAMEKQGEVPDASTPNNQIFKIIGEIPDELVQKLNAAANKHGRTTQSQAQRSLLDGLELQDAIAAVSNLLSQTPPPFSEDGWKPDESECLTFIKGCISVGVSRRQHEIAMRQRLEEIYEKQDGVCAVCGNHIDIDEAVKDYIVPLNEGGTTTIDNLQMLCRHCNKAKNNR